MVTFPNAWILWAGIVLGLLALAYLTPADSTAWYAPFAHELRGMIQRVSENAGKAAGGGL